MRDFDLLVVGELNPDVIVRGGDVVPAFGQAEQLVDAADLVLGASGAIVACGAARLGLRVAYAGLVGDDRMGAFVLEGLAAAGVDTALVQRRSGERTGLGVHLVRDDGDRAMLTFPGLIAALRAGDVPAAALAAARHVHVASPFLQAALRPELAALLAAARAAGATTSLDPNWDPAGDFALDDVLPHLDVLLPNAEELRRVARCDDVEEGARRIAAGGPAVAVKLGADGALLCDGDRVVRVGAPPPAAVVDAIGAGDTFDAGFLVGWLGGSPRDALALGCAAATLSLRAAGGTGGQPERAEAAALAAELLSREEPPAPAADGDGFPDATSAELASQPAIWRRALALPGAALAKLPQPGERVLALGCGTSYYVLDAYARRRQELEGSLTRAAIASELDELDDHDVVLYLSRSGTTSDLLAAHERFAGRVREVAIVGDPDTPLPAAVDTTLELAFADERSVVQTRFASTALLLLRHSLGEALGGAVADAEAALAAELPVPPLRFEHVVFLGTGWTLGVAHEAALKCREAGQMFTEAYAIGEYQHGPVALADARTLVWSFAPLPAPLRSLCEQAGATVREPRWDPLAELVAVHRLAVATAHAKGLDPDRPRHLSRSVVLEG
jgi:sugar/nucleoside kinase (ribokinase family)/fructoselysine-6-P-deglycase FrlB-like protein